MADLPIANISRIMKNALPDNAKIAKDAKECVQECVTEFIAFITSEGIYLFILCPLLFSLFADGPCLSLLSTRVYCSASALHSFSLSIPSAFSLCPLSSLSASVVLYYPHHRSYIHCILKSLVASEKCHQEKRKTVNGEDIIFAMTSLGFENYAEVLKIYLAKYRQVKILPQSTPRICAISDSSLPESPHRLLNLFFHQSSLFSCSCSSVPVLPVP